MERVGFITHGGATILKVDLSHPTDVEENIATIKKAQAIIETHPPKSLLILTDVTGTVFNTRGVEEMKRYSAFNTPYVKASAVVGVSGLARIIYDAVVKVIGRSVVRFDTEVEALDWLARQ
ncbi:MAG TPA: hypothetical protein VMT19_05085 [Thermoanaerobaculaceae bacterium]|nr:hypothetical protein [Thermoanaerobaculaceae bacterium]